MQKIYAIIIFIVIPLYTSICSAKIPKVIIQSTSQNVFGENFSISQISVKDKNFIYPWYKNETLLHHTDRTESEALKPSLLDSKSLYKSIVSSEFGCEASLNAIRKVNRIGGRVTVGIQMLYDFDEAGGDFIFDNSGIEPPYNLIIDNPSSATWTPYGLGINDKVYMNENPPAIKLIDSCELTNEITIEVWVKPAFATQLGGARMVTLSPNAQNCNFSLVQNDQNFGFRLRTTTTTNRGEPALLTAIGTAHNKLTHLVCTRSSDGTAKIYKDGIAISSGIFLGDFSNWDPTYRFQIGNEFINPREWLGTFYLVAIYNRALSPSEVLQNYYAGVEVDHKPEIIIEPADQGLLVGDDAIFRVNAVGDDVLEYQWRKNGVDIPYAKDPEYIVSSVSLFDNGDTYSCLIKNSLGSDFSRSARLSVTALNSRVTTGQIVYYNFQEGMGDTIKDHSGFGVPLNLFIKSPNSVKWKPYGLFVDTAANISSGSAATIVNDVAIANGEFSIELWVKQMQQTKFPATMFSISSNSNERRNFSLIQQNGFLETRLRYFISPLTGSKIFDVPNDSNTDSLVHIVFIRSTKELSKLFINGSPCASAYQVKGDLSNWNTGYSLKLANEIFAGQPWTGLFNLVSIYDHVLDLKEIQQNYKMGPVGKMEVSAPTNLIANAEAPRKVKLSWFDNSDTEDGFIIERKEIDQNYEIIDSIPANITSYFDLIVKDNTKYFYRIKGYNFIKQSAYSNEFEVTTMLTDSNDGNTASSAKYEYKLEQNYPNPFNPSTKIKFSIPNSNKVSIQIYNQLGEMIFQPVNDFYETGNYEVEINMQDFTSGVYLYKITSGSFSIIKKMILTK